MEQLIRTSFQNPSYRRSSLNQRPRTSRDESEDAFVEIPLNHNHTQEQINDCTTLDKEEIPIKAKFKNFFKKPKKEKATPHISIANYTITSLLVNFIFQLYGVSGLPCVYYKRENFDLIDSDECVR